MNKRSCVGNVIFFYFNDYGILDTFHIKDMKRQGIFPTNMLAYLDINISCFYYVFTEDIANMMCQIHHLNLEK